MGMALVSTTIRIPLAKSLPLPVSTTLGSAGLEDLIPLREMLPPRDNNYSLELEVETATCSFCDLYTFESTSTEGSYSIDRDD